MNNLIHHVQQALGVGVKEQFPLSTLTTLKIGGPAQYYFEANTCDDVVKAIQLCLRLQIPYTILGGGSNVLIGDSGINGLVIKNNTRSISLGGMKGRVTRNEREENVFVEVDSGVPFNHLVRYTLEEGFGGIEMHLGLPGTVGGAMYMNSKWTHPVGYVGDAVHQATLITQTGEIITVPVSYFCFAYDYSRLQTKHDTLLTVTFSFTKKNKDELWSTANDAILYRRKTQPQGVRSAGCTFKNITTAQALIAKTPGGITSSGFLIDKAGCKDMSVGDASVSDMHANFIINKGAARSSDVIKLIENIRGRVYDVFGIKLEEEIIRLGA